MHPNWKTLATSNLKWKIFVKAKDEGSVLDRDIGECGNVLSFNGEEAKEVYETIIQDFGAYNLIINDKQADPELHVEVTSSKFSNDIATDVGTQIDFGMRFKYKAMMYAQNNKVGS